MNSIKQSLRRTFIQRWSVPIALLWACVLGFGLTIPWLGLYADDWPFVYVNHLAGLHGVVNFISWVRPVAAWVFAGAAALVGTQFWLFHTILLILRWLDAVLLWRVLRRVWPNQEQPALWTALLFAVYPAFKQQPLALEYIPHFIALALLFSSLEISLAQANQPKRNLPLSILSWLGSFQVFIIEYFAGLELLRPVMVFLTLRRCMDWRSAAKRAVLLWLPYLPVMIGFLAWRVFVVGFPSYQPELVSGLGSSPFTAVKQLGKTIGHDLWTGGIAAWMQPFTTAPSGGRLLLLWIVIVGAALLSFGVYLSVLEKSRTENSPASQGIWPFEAIAVGIFAMLIAGWPFWITRIPLSLDFPWDRTSLAFMVGACLLAAGIIGLLAYLPGRRWIPPLAVAALLAFSSGLLLINANSFRREWSILTGFYWQMTWRAPGLQPGTAIVLDQSPFNYHVDKFLSPLVNWTYAPDSHTLQTPFALLDFYKLWGKALPPKSTTDPLQTRYGTLAFSGNTGQMILVVYAPPGCLHLLTSDDEARLLLSPEMKQSLALSNLQTINPDPVQPAQPPAFLGSEPAHDWCYFFEKGELAVQNGEAQTAVNLADQALAAGYRPKQVNEYLPFVYAYAKTGRWEDAKRLSLVVTKEGDFYRNAACVTWVQIGKQIDASHAQPVLAELKCP